MVSSISMKPPGNAQQPLKGSPPRRTSSTSLFSFTTTQSAVNIGRG